MNLLCCHLVSPSSSWSSLWTFTLPAMQLWQIHVAEKMILDDLEANPEKYKDKKLSELTDDEDFDEENSVIHTKAYYKKSLIPKVILVSTAHKSMYWSICRRIHLLVMCFFVFGRKQVLKNLTWRLPLLSVRSTIPFSSFSFFLAKTLAYLSHLCVSLNLLLSLIRGPFLFCWTAP